MKKITIIGLFLLEFAGTTLAQKTISNQNRAWVTYLGNHKIKNKFGIHTEYQWRLEDGFNYWQQSLARFGIDSN